jgi:hypothetical protein
VANILPGILRETVSKNGTVISTEWKVLRDMPERINLEFPNYYRKPI